MSHDATERQGAQGDVAGSDVEVFGHPIRVFEQRAVGLGAALRVARRSARVEQTGRFVGRHDRRELPRGLAPAVADGPVVADPVVVAGTVDGDDVVQGRERLHLESLPGGLADRWRERRHHVQVVSPEKRGLRHENADLGVGEEVFEFVRSVPGVHGDDSGAECRRG